MYALLYCMPIKIKLENIGSPSSAAVTQNVKILRSKILLFFPFNYLLKTMSFKVYFKCIFKKYLCVILIQRIILQVDCELISLYLLVSLMFTFSAEEDNPHIFLYLISNWNGQSLYYLTGLVLEMKDMAAGPVHVLNVSAYILLTSNKCQWHYYVYGTLKHK